MLSLCDAFQGNVIIISDNLYAYQCAWHHFLTCISIHIIISSLILQFSSNSSLSSFYHLLCYRQFMFNLPKQRERERRIIFNSVSRAFPWDIWIILYSVSSVFPWDIWIILNSVPRIPPWDIWIILNCVQRLSL